MKGVAVERIWLDTNWCELCILQLDSYFDAYMLPEIICPKLKPSYVYSHFLKIPTHIPILSNR